MKAVELYQREPKYLKSSYECSTGQDWPRKPSASAKPQPGVYTYGLSRAVTEDH